MSTYSNYSHSNSLNAGSAEREGRMPATWMAKTLRQKSLFRGVTAKAILDAVPTTEWDYIGPYERRVNYYGMADIWRACEALRARIAELRSSAKAEPERGRAVKAEWLEWSGIPGQRRAWQRRATNINVTIKGQHVTLHLPGARDLRKKIGARGLYILLGNGREVAKRSVRARVRPVPVSTSSIVRVSSVGFGRPQRQLTTRVPWCSVIRIRREPRWPNEPIRARNL